MIPQKHQGGTGFSRQQNKNLPPRPPPHLPFSSQHLGAQDINCVSLGHFSPTHHTKWSAQPEPQFPLNFPFTSIFVTI